MSDWRRLGLAHNLSAMPRWSWCVALSFLACGGSTEASALPTDAGIDTGSSGGTGSGGGGSGGTEPLDGGAAAGAGGAPECTPGWKLCGSVCQLVSPLVGCGGVGCEACPVPANAVQAVCAGASCNFVCLPGYQKVASICVEEGTCILDFCPAPEPPAVKCCVSPKGPCGADFNNGCQGGG